MSDDLDRAVEYLIADLRPILQEDRLEERRRQAIRDADAPPSDVALAIGGRIAARRGYLGMTQLDVATAMGKKRAAVQHWESGQNNIMAADLVKLAGVLRTTAAWLIGDPSTSTANVDEAELLSMYRELPADTQTLVRASIAGMLNASKSTG